MTLFDLLGRFGSRMRPRAVSCYQCASKIKIRIYKNSQQSDKQYVQNISNTYVVLVNFTRPTVMLKGSLFQHVGRIINKGWLRLNSRKSELIYRISTLYSLKKQKNLEQPCPQKDFCVLKFVLGHETTWPSPRPMPKIKHFDRGCS